jgi:hypothetical protein
MTNNAFFKTLAVSIIVDLHQPDSQLNNCRLLQSEKQIIPDHLRQPVLPFGRGSPASNDNRLVGRRVWNGRGMPSDPREYFPLHQHTHLSFKKPVRCVLCGDNSIVQCGLCNVRLCISKNKRSMGVVVDGSVRAESCFSKYHRLSAVELEKEGEEMSKSPPRNA